MAKYNKTKFDPNDPNDPRHGVASGYTYHHCRCDKCKEAFTVYMQRYQKPNKIKTPKITKIKLPKIPKSTQQYTVSQNDNLQHEWDIKSDPSVGIHFPELIDSNKYKQAMGYLCTEDNNIDSKCASLLTTLSNLFYEHRIPIETILYRITSPYSSIAEIARHLKVKYVTIMAACRKFTEIHPQYAKLLLRDNKAGISQQKRRRHEILAGLKRQWSAERKYKYEQERSLTQEVN